MSDHNPRGKKEKKEISTLLGWVRYFNNLCTPNLIGWVFAIDCIICLVAIKINGATGMSVTFAIVTFILALRFWSLSDYKKGNY
tara:strand:+ start:480 stop:731 length:252 start_codon:yes stop_codon:yes gene_type:complete